MGAKRRRPNVMTRSHVGGMVGVRGDEERVVQAFCVWLQSHGWIVQREVAFVDVYAERGGQRLYAEAKGRTSSLGLDLDTLYGQLLRRMDDIDEAVRYAVVVPTAAVPAALRVPSSVRHLLHVDVYGVTEEGEVAIAVER